ncbi:MAG: DNA topoisomerase IB [Pseudonocardia sp.]|uniref:DNA topoisomerase IB n=1 Tax=unclassified Pseudonocardia TaxID=2619320 RepID=UPI000AC6E61F|nr:MULTISPECIES: DNA topoisomerase IB [unclassified Pseudonocardia]MBN9107611.1 DNA topoisomerase IB [Pseudonocardia sp.]
MPDDEDLPNGLTRSDTAAPGWTRQRRGKGWSYSDDRGEIITDPLVRTRIGQLAIPPAWRDVWIAPEEHGHIQAVGTDDAGRRQYLYHPVWREARDQVKHDRALVLGSRMPRIRAEIAARLGERGLGARRVLAAGLRMLDLGVFRAGGEQYAPENPDDDGTFGLATLLREHATLTRGAVLVDYPAKGGIQRSVRLADPDLHKVIGSLRRRRGGGDELLAFRNAGRGQDWHDVTTADLNAAVKELAGDEMTCKDLRTWNATVLAAVELAARSRDGIPDAERARNRQVTQTMNAVSDHLGNTPAVARASYVDPRVVERYEDGRTILRALRRVGDVTSEGGSVDGRSRDILDRAVVRLIRKR